MTSTLPELLNAKEAAEYLHLTTYTVNLMCRRGDIPATKFGHHWYIRVEDLRSLFDPKIASPAGSAQDGPATVVAVERAPLRSGDRTRGGANS